MIKRLPLVLLSCLLMAACNAQDSSAAGAASSYRDGVDFQTLPRPVNTEDSSRIEVAEVFWYGCIHCYRLEPTLENWVAALPEDVNFVRVPAMWAPAMELHARLYYATKALGVLEQTHWPVFQALNEQGNRLDTEARITSFVGGLGVNEEQFRRAFTSFGASSQVIQARSKAVAYGVRGTPEIIVEGKYRISTELTGTQEKMLEVAAWLIERERQARSSAN